MSIDTSKTTINGKTCHRYLFRESNREDGKVKNRTLGKISMLSGQTFKPSHPEIRPVHVRTEASTRGHVFALMLAYKIERQLSQLWKKCGCTVPEGSDERIQGCLQLRGNFSS